MTTSESLQTRADRPATERWDCHLHLFGPVEQYPQNGRGGVPPAVADFDSLAAMHADNGFNHGVFVQPTQYGDDFSYLLEALRLGQGRYRGMAMGTEALADADLDALHAAGLRGARFMMPARMGLTPDAALVKRVATAIAGRGWVLKLMGDINEIEGVLAVAGPGDFAVVIDHLALTGPGKPDELARVRRLLEQPNVWMQLSSGHRLSATEDYSDMVPIGAGYYALAPDRCIWGSDWPYMNPLAKIPEQRALALLKSYLPDAAAFDAVMGTNPARLFA